MSVLVSTFAGAELEDELRDFCARAQAHTALASERKLAEQFNISHATVRRVLDTLFNDGLIYREQGRGTFVAAPAATRRQVGTLICVDTWHNIEHPHYAGRLRGIMQAARELEYRLEILDTGRRVDAELICDNLRRPEIAGMIVPWVLPESYARMRQIAPHTPLVATTPPRQDSNLCAVLVDFRNVGQQAADYLRREGSQRPLVVSAHAEARIGFTTAAEAELQPIVMALDSVTPEAAERVVARWREERADGIFIDDDVAAQLVLDRLGEPDSPFICLANKGNMQLPNVGAKLLVDSEQIGRLLVRTLSALRDEPAFTGTSISLRPKLILPRT